MTDEQEILASLKTNYNQIEELQLSISALLESMRSATTTEKRLRLGAAFNTTMKRVIDHTICLKSKFAVNPPTNPPNVNTIECPNWYKTVIAQMNEHSTILTGRNRPGYVIEPAAE